VTIAPDVFLAAATDFIRELTPPCRFYFKAAVPISITGQEHQRKLAAQSRT
jgi:hypothetical protein